MTDLHPSYKVKAAILKALACPTRLFIVERLEQGEHSVGELEKMIGSDISTVSKHLAVLRSAGIVRYEKRGQQVFYSLSTPCVMRFLECVETVLRSNIKEQNRAIK